MDTIYNTIILVLPYTPDYECSGGVDCSKCYPPIENTHCYKSHRYSAEWIEGAHKRAHLNSRLFTDQFQT